MLPERLKKFASGEKVHFRANNVVAFTATSARL